MPIYVTRNNELVEFTGNDFLEKLYFLKIEMPTKKTLDSAILKINIENIDTFLKENINNATKLLKTSNFLPLYDIINENIHLIEKNDVYNKVVYEHYRYPTKSYIESKYKKIKLQLKNKKVDDRQLKERLLRKLKIMKQFINSFDDDMFYQIYIDTFYHSNPVGKNMTTCLRKSFTPHYKHLSPFYEHDEIIKLALNMKLINKNNIIDSKLNIDELCNKVRENDISSKIIIEHQKHIFKNKKYGLIQYFTFHGSYFMNKYLRENDDNKNEILEKNIFLMDELIKTAPKFNKNYTLYRFVCDDHYISKLKIGDVCVFDGFTSTTRDPFYNPESYKFGFILIKIKIPKNIEGIALCVESVSVFPSEQELILSPNAILKLDAKNINVEYFTLDKYQSMINTMYEFSFIGYEKISLTMQTIIPKIFVDFLKIDKINALTFNEKINYFTNKYVNDLYQFTTLIGNKEYNVTLEWYNSTGIYKDFYAAKTSNGLAFYTLQDGNVLFMIEIGEHDELYFYVNYNRKFLILQESENEINDNDILLFFAKIANYFDINNILIYCDYVSCDVHNKVVLKCRGGNYCVDYYNYLKNNKKRFMFEDKQIAEIKPAFSYYNLDILKNIETKKIITRKNSDDMIYQVYRSVYDKETNVADFFVWLIENYCYLSTDFICKLKNIYTIGNNPFFNDYYVFNAPAYLYNRGEILYYQANNSKIKGVNKNKNRLNENVRLRS